MIFGRAVKALAVASASRLASVPELVKRIRAIDGKRRWISTASATSRRLWDERLKPSASASTMDCRITAFEWPYSPAVNSPRASR
ncbi:hypothetical protein D3C72_1694600 [compost metagenome]